MSLPPGGARQVGKTYSVRSYVEGPRRRRRAHASTQFRDSLRGTTRSSATQSWSTGLGLASMPGAYSGSTMRESSTSVTTSRPSRFLSRAMPSTTTSRCTYATLAYSWRCWRTVPKPTSSRSRADGCTSCRPGHVRWRGRPKRPLLHHGFRLLGSPQTIRPPPRTRASHKKRPPGGRSSRRPSPVCSGQARVWPHAKLGRKGDVRFVI